MNIKIVDFGLSNLYTSDQLLKTACGSPCYAAPEMIAGKKYKGLNADIWSSGIILFALICGYLPFDDNDTQALYKKIMRGEYTIPAFVSNGATDLIKRILCTDPERRFTIEQIKSHPWFQLYKGYVNIPKGLIIGYHIIPIDLVVIENVISLGFEREVIEQSISSNRHNKITTLYSLFLQKLIKSGHISNADISSLCFPRKPIIKAESKPRMLEIQPAVLPEVKYESIQNPIKPEPISITDTTVNAILANHHAKIQNKSKQTNMAKLNNTTMLDYEQKLKDIKPKNIVDPNFAKAREHLAKYQTESNNEIRKRNHSQNKQIEHKEIQKGRNESVIPNKVNGQKLVAPKSNMPIIDKVI